MNRKTERAKRTRLGRMLCRLLGDRAGGVMLEYVIIGVMVAAAAVLGVMLFGRQIVGGLNVLIQVLAGKDNAAEATAKENQANAPKDVEAAENRREAISPVND